jgi:Leucine-rich repeat (LRR) protein
MNPMLPVSLPLLWVGSIVWVLVGRHSVAGGGLNCRISEAELAGLQSLFESCNGNAWLWNTGLSSSTIWSFPANTSDPCFDEWQGVECAEYSGSNCSVVGLHLAGYNLEGPLPHNISSLVNLATFNVSNNTLFSSIPLSIGSSSMPELSVFDVSYNRLSGLIPSFSSNISSIVATRNNFTGNFYPTICSSYKLLRLSLGMNNMSGPIPACIGDLNLLQIFDVGNNRLDETIPSAIGSLLNLTYLDVSMNLLSGSLPTQLGLLTNVEALLVSSNRFDGQVPTNLGTLQLLNSLDVSNNRISGPLPSS